MNIKEIEEIQKSNAKAELDGWLSVLAINLGTLSFDDVNNIKNILYMLSQTQKSVRRYGHFVGLDAKE